ncbi:hypothetical protein H310_03874 [Aphanomyces invadans]|uniref:Uncharacterized protein n=1 Tax=Aphanomyces invadans TaxID=157072 RepID=A0A024UET5_9STRA|nr:hypothetical protein H310_03874 [Aphanomyces invadans]ETW04725.1 hypothetical protein H310_03874 [Aphanomyces invadans]|eukprot:XP_008866163.1 hypothetical protein H310_03874 [Aphanomyces invadans]
MEWVVGHAVEKGCTFALLFSMCVATSAVAQYCEFHFLRFAKQSPYVPDAFKSLAAADQRSTFYQVVVLSAMGVWTATVFLVLAADVPRRSMLGVVYSCYTGGLFGLAHFFKQAYLVADSASPST